jgi:hypothetical protein
VSDPTTVAEETARATAAEKALSDRIAKLEPTPPPPPPPPSPTLAVTTSIPDGATLKGAVTWVVVETIGVAHHVDFAIDGTVVWPEKTAPWGGSLDTKNVPGLGALTDGPHTLVVTAYDAAGKAITIQARVTVANGLVSPPPPPPPPPSGSSKGAGSAWIHTKDNIQVRRNGNGDVAIQLVKKGTGPITGFRIQTRYGQPDEVYHKGDGGKYAVAALLGGPTGTVVASTTWLPGVGNADAHYPTVTFDAPSADVPDGTPFWIRILNVHANPDSNYLSINVLHTFGTDEVPRQPLFPDPALAVLVNTGSGWVDRHQTPNIDVLPGHEGFAYTQCLIQSWKAVGGSAEVRETFTIDAPLTFTRLQASLRRASGTTKVATLTLETAAGVPVVSGNVPYASIPVSSPGGDNGGQTVGTATVPAKTIPAGTYRLRVTSTGLYYATPVRKALKGTYPSLTVDWGSYMCPGFAEYSSDGGATWKLPYGSQPAQLDWQFAVLP